jgi:hypothetical protein
MNMYDLASVDANYKPGNSIKQVIKIVPYLEFSRKVDNSITKQS